MSIIRTAPLAATAAFVALAAHAQERLGTFEGRNGFTAEGTGKISMTEGKQVIFEQDFLITEHGSQPVVALGAGDDVMIVHDLRSIRGIQQYDLPEDLDLSAVDAIYIWSRSGDFPMAVAELE